MGTVSAETTLGEIVRLRDAGLSLHEYCRAAAERVHRVVPFDGSCGMTIDPATTLITGQLSVNLPDWFPQLAANEYLTDDVNKFAELARRKEPVAVLGRTTRGRPDRSPRYRDLLVPNGLGPELRAAFVTRGACWGGLILVREQGKPDFTEEEAVFFSSASRSMAEGLRAAVAMDTAIHDELPGGPGLLLVNARGEIERANAAADYWLDELGATSAAVSGPRLPAAVVSAAAAALEGNGSVPREGVRVRGRSGSWISISAARLSGQPPLASVLLQAARPKDVAPLILEAYGLTPREREVAEHVLRSRSTAEIAAALFISPYTVQDHLKGVFEKTGVRNRKELVARVFFDYQLPRIEARAAGAAHAR